MSEEWKLESVVVCVTGASGFIASYLVKLLLLRGYTVHATVRNPNDEAKTEHLKRLEGAKERLHLFKADLMEEGSFDSAIVGCQGVFHTASPVNFNVTDPQAELLEPAVKGTMNVLAACKRSPSVRRVILTSSASTVLFTEVPLTRDVVVDESWFSKPEFCSGHDWKWYITSKILAEEAAWKFSKENGLDMISMIPGMVNGPMLQPTLNESVAFILNLANGGETHPNAALPLPWVHVKDVAEAHIRAFEIPSANGRYCLAECVVYHSDIVKLLLKLYPTLQLPNTYTDDGALGETYQVSKEKVKSLGIDYIPFEVGLKETIENLSEKKLLHSL